MNLITVNNRKFFREFRNGSTFSVDPGVFSTFFKANTLERVKFTTSISVKTVVVANSSNEIQFITDGVNATWILPSNWAPEGFKTGDTVRFVRGGLIANATISSISAGVMVTNDPGFIGTLLLASGNFYDDLEVRNTTTPTSLIFQYGIVPNILPPPSLTTASPSFLSWLDGQAQSYFANGIGAAPTALTGTSTASAQLTESLTAQRLSITDSYIFTFQIEHIFRVEFFIAAYLSDLINNTKPFAFTSPNSLRYITQYNFGVSATDPNELRVFNDTELNGSLGFIGDSFTNGVGNYIVDSMVYKDVALNFLPSLEVTITNYCTTIIKKTSGNFAAGQKVIIYLSKLPTETEYSNSSTSWSAIRVFDTVTQVEGAAAVASVALTNVVVSLNADPTKLDVNFRVTYNSLQVPLIDPNENYGIFMSIGDITLSADLSDGKVVWVDVNTYTKNTDISGLILSNEIECYTAEKNPSSGTGDTSDFKLWNGRLEEFRATFRLKKFAAATLVNQIILRTFVTKIEAQLVTWDNVANVEGILETFNIPLVETIAPVLVGGAFYQYYNVNGFGNFNINPTAIANNYKVKAAIPGVFGDQPFIVIFPMIIPDRTDLLNATIPISFFDDTKPNNNQNYKTSNYSGVGNFGIYVKLNVTVRHLGIDTIYELYTEKSVVRDYDIDPPTNNWSCVHEILDPADVVIPNFNYSAINKIRSTFSMATAGALTLADLVAEHVLTPKDESEPGFRLHSSVDWNFDGNPLESIDGTFYVKIVQDVPGNKIIVTSQVKANSLDVSKQYKIASHLYENR